MKRRARGALATAAAVGLALVWAVTLRPQALGGPALETVVRGDSMEPTYVTGDLVVVRAEPGYAVGDIVAYRVPDGELGAGRVVLHRIVGGDGINGFVVQGDNNPAPDPWMPRTGDIAGRAWFAVAGLGRVIAFLHQPLAAAAFGAAIAVTLVLARGSRRRTELVDAPPPIEPSDGPAVASAGGALPSV